MNKLIIVSIAALLISSCAPQKTLTPWTDSFNDPRDPAIVKEARSFIIQRQGCDHFRGEPGYDEERQKLLNEQIKKLCTGTDKRLAKLRLRYSDSPETVKALADFEDCIEYESRCSTTEPE
ncbi:MAG: hypothetical protein ABJP02_15970 [Parasphingorhabdus sp.]|uniref:hypothetical protein n=1 Tax=Parasphingorhabdus sp. TaxID=2709688 RepID=UPI0032976097